MPEREALVIACPNPLYGELKFLPALGRRVFRMLTSPEHGNCDPVRSTLVEAPGRDDFEQAFFNAFEGAADRRRDLIVYFLGHGHQIAKSQSFYVVHRDSRGNANVIDLRKTLEWLKSMERG